MDFGKERKSLDMLASAAVGGAAASVFAVLLLTVTAALTLFSPDPASLSWLGFAVNIACCFSGAFIGARCTEKRPFVAGVISGVMFTVTAAAVALIISGRLHPAFLPVLAAVTLLAAFLGSVRRSKARIPAFESGELRIKNKEL